ncbi:hypothetical protein CCP3SC5AM1_1960006 [Gammaproteobacteria bacterium]
MKILITENQYNRLNKSSQRITNAIIKYMNEYIDKGERKIAKKSRNYGNLREDWCINGKETIVAIYYFDKDKFENGHLIVSGNIVENFSKLLSIRRSYVLHVIEEWYDDTMVPKFEEITGESGLSIDEIDASDDEHNCIPEPVKPEGITDEEMIDFIYNNTAYRKEEIIDKIKSGERDLEDFYLDIMGIVKRKEIIDFNMKIIITEQQSNELLSSMLEDMFNDYEIKFEGDLRNIYVNGKLMAQLGPSSGVVSLDAFNELKDNLFFNSDKDLREEVANWIRNKFKSKNNIGKYGVSFKKLHGQERDLPKKERKPHHATRQDKLEPGFNLDAFKERTSNIETKLKNKEDLIRAAREKMNPDSFANWWKKETKLHNEREKRKQEKNKQDIENAVQLLKKL